VVDAAAVDAPTGQRQAKRRAGTIGGERQRLFEILAARRPERDASPDGQRRRDFAPRQNLGPSYPLVIVVLAAIGSDGDLAIHPVLRRARRRPSREGKAKKWRERAHRASRALTCADESGAQAMVRVTTGDRSGCRRRRNRLVTSDGYIQISGVRLHHGNTKHAGRPSRTTFDDSASAEHSTATVAL
jgi:hypothetical protein